jgi:hypothetical protein
MTRWRHQRRKAREKLHRRHGPHLVCKHERRALVTLDPDFANVQAFPPAEYPGLMVLRLQRQDKRHVLAAFQRIMPLLEIEPLERKLWIVEEHRVRLRD